MIEQVILTMFYVALGCGIPLVLIILALFAEILSRLKRIEEMLK